MKKRPLFLLMALMLLTACSSPVDSQVPTGTIVPTSTKALSTLTSTLTLRPVTETLTSTPDFEGTMTALGNAVMTVSPPRLHAAYLSPDNKWRIEIIIYHCVPIPGMDPRNAYAYEQLKLIQVETKTTEAINDQLQSCGGLGAFGLDGEFWSSNGRYFYYTDAREGLPDGLCGYWERPLLRLDVTDRSTEHLGMGPVSPDGRKLATWQDSYLVVWSLDEGEIGRSPATPADAVRGPIVWSPDGEALVYLQTEDDCFPFGKSYVMRLDLRDMNPELLIESESPSFVGITWDDPERIILSDEKGKVWRYDLETNELEPVPG